MYNFLIGITFGVISKKILQLGDFNWLICLLVFIIAIPIFLFINNEFLKIKKYIYADISTLLLLSLVFQFMINYLIGWKIFMFFSFLILYVIINKSIRTKFLGNKMENNNVIDLLELHELIRRCDLQLMFVFIGFVFGALFNI